jgi:hypothetical protein
MAVEHGAELQPVYRFGYRFSCAPRATIADWADYASESSYAAVRIPPALPVLTTPAGSLSSA